MWNDEQKQRFQELRSRERQQELTVAEKTELARMIQELEEEEAAYLRPANQRLDAKIRRTQEQNIALETLVEREKRLNRYLQKVLKKVDSECHAISTELASILEASSASEMSR